MSRGSIKQFLAEAERSGVFSPALSQEITAQISRDSSLTADQVASQLVEGNILTMFQAEQLLAGRGSECFIASRYRVLEKLGEGGMGAVYKAQDTNLDRVVAIKVLPAGRLNDEDAIARFQREAKALARLSHPHIIQAYDSGSDQGRHFLVMEYVEGLGLDKVLRQHGALAPAAAADFIHQAAVGLEHAHDKGLVHRDLKPANLLVAGVFPQRPAGSKGAGSKSSPPVIKILDLGLARFLQDQLGDRQLTQEGTGMGTPDYMAPEQFRDALNADVRCDIYGLGCTLYHLIAGQVPFPGSSFSEKAHAHAKKEPIPLEERCPDVPAGLAQVVAKMMAKHPQERFQTASELTVALAPFVSGSSQSVIRLKASGEWKNLSPAKTKESRRPAIVAASIGAASVATLLIGLFLAWPHLFPDEVAKVTIPPGGGAELHSNGDAPKNGETKPDSNNPQPKPAPKVVTIENGLTVAKDGTGQYQTISEALENISSGQTIRVLDAAVYKEGIIINRPASQTGITLETTTGATLQFPSSCIDGIGLKILSVPRVTLRGFRMTNESTLRFMIIAGLRSPGFHLQSVQMTANIPTICHVSLENIPPTAERSIIEDCTLQGGSGGVRLSGFIAYDTPGTCGNVLVRNNTVLDTVQGILLVGALKQVCVSGNRVAFAGSVGMQLENLLPGAEDILIANNTIAESATGFRYWDNGKTPPRRKGIRLSNNLVLKSAQADMMFLDSGGDAFNPRGPGEGASLHGAWRWEHNWRETKVPTGTGIFEKSWIPIAPGDKREDEIGQLNLDPKSVDFLQPEKDSPLATAGAGGDLPGYVGAVPPVGVTAWDWDRTWKALETASKVVTIENGLTVAQDGTGQFKTIGEALEKVSEGQTIRVLDDATYTETLSINRPAQHGITLEAAGKATLSFPHGTVGLRIAEVPGVTVRGFKCQHDGEMEFLIVASGKCQKLCLDSLDFSISAPNSGGVSLERMEPTGDPTVIENCRFNGGRGAVRISGCAGYSTPDLCGRVVIRDNTILECAQAILLLGSVQQIQIVGNRIGSAGMVGIQLENLLPGTDEILIANNSIFDCRSAIRFWDDAKRERPKNVRLLNNLFLKSRTLDIIVVDSGGDPSNVRAAGDGKNLVDVWKWSRNWRETKEPIGTDMFTRCWVPVANDDHREDSITVLSRIPKDADFLQPAKDSPLATAGVGGDLPSYVGAVPPPDVAPWDWNRTWKALGPMNGK